MIEVLLTSLENWGLGEDVLDVMGLALDPLRALRRPPDPLPLKKKIHAPLNRIPGYAPERLRCFKQCVL